MNKKISRLTTAIVTIFAAMLACNVSGSATEEPPTELVAVDILPNSSQTESPIQHQTIPVSAPEVQPYPDVTSVDTAPEKRAPYGDSYAINRLERPFTQDMTYIPDMDISAFGIGEDSDWYYVSIGLVGNNPNNPANIRYGLELDTDLDSFGDVMIVADPPYSESWTADNIKIYTDTNHDSAGVSPVSSDAPFNGDGYDKLISSPLEGIGDDFDVAWIRINAGPLARVQFAFKKSFSGDVFMYSVMADAGLKDVARLDYVDYFTEKDAGSSVRKNQYYPLKQLFAVDNTCYQAFGFKSSGIEPKVCPVIVQPVNIREPGVPPGGEPGCAAYGEAPGAGGCCDGVPTSGGLCRYN